MRSRRFVPAVLALLLLMAAIPLQRAHAYSWTVVNYGPAPILHITAHTVSSLCTNLSPKLPPGGLKPGQSVSFDNNWDPYQKICLVYKVEVSYTDPVGRDVDSPYVQEIRPSADAISAARVKAQSDLAAAQGKLPAAQKELRDAQAGVNTGPHTMRVAPWTPGGNPDADPGRPQASPQAESRLYNAQQAVYAIQNQIDVLQKALVSGDLVQSAYTPPIHPPFWDNGVWNGRGSGTFVVGRYNPNPAGSTRPGWAAPTCQGNGACPTNHNYSSGICYHSGFTDFMKDRVLPVVEKTLIDQAQSYADGSALVMSLIKELAPEVWLAMMLESAGWALAGTYVVRLPPGVPPPSLPSLKLINASYITSDFNQMRATLAAFNKTLG